MAGQFPINTSGRNASGCEMPRQFRLRDELDAGEKQTTEGICTISWGLDDDDDAPVELHRWSGIIHGPAKTLHDGKMYELEIICGENYPKEPPIVRFKNKINMHCVNCSNGLVNPEKFTMLGKNWNSGYTIKAVLTELRKTMTLKENAKRQQPGEGDRYA